MISWQDIQDEVVRAQIDHPQNALDIVRRKAYDDLVVLTGRPLLVYGSAFQNPMKAGAFGPLLSIDLTDKDGFEEMVGKTASKKVDVLIQSPGGSAEATESLVAILRAHFNDVRFIVTGAAKSAATMLVMSGNEIMISTAGELGPIDPQLNLGQSFVPAGSLKEEFDKAASDITDNPDRLPVWLPILEKYPPGLLTQCDNFIQLARDLVATWLEAYMFKGDRDKKEKAAKVATYLADEKNTLSHARRIDAQKIASLGVKVVRVEDQSDELQDALRKVHLCVGQTLDYTDAYKLFESSDGGALIRSAGVAPSAPPMIQMIPGQPA